MNKANIAKFIQKMAVRKYISNLHVSHMKVRLGTARGGHNR